MSGSSLVGGFAYNGGGVRTRSSVRISTGDRTVSTSLESCGNTRKISNEDGEVCISRGVDGTITLVVAPTDGEARTHTYTARSKEEFSKKYPKFSAKYLQ